MRIALIGDTSDRVNWGCRATTMALLSLIKPYASEIDRWDMQNITARWNGNSSRRTRSPFHRIKGRILRRLSTAPANEITKQNLDGAATRLVSLLPDLWEALAQADVVIINGEGSFLERRRGGRLMLLIAYTVKTRLKNKLIICNHTSDVRDQVMHDLASAVYPMIDDVLFRELESLRLSGPLCGDAPHAFAADAAFTFRPAPIDTWVPIAARSGYWGDYPNFAECINVGLPYICVGGSSAYFAGGRPSFDHYTAYSLLCRELSRLCPVVLTAAGQPEDEVFRRIGQELSIPVVGTSTPTQQAVDLLGNATLYVGGRWHPGIMALTGGTPLVMLSANTSFKSNGLMELAGLQQAPYSSFGFQHQIEEIVSRAKTLISEGENRRAILRSRSLELSDSAHGNIRILSQLR